MTGLWGKLPAHGDFVRRGGPVAVLAALDRWLDDGLGRAPHLHDRIDALDGWRFAVAHDPGFVLGAMIASEDSVGRGFPLVATFTAAAPIAADAAGDWAEQAVAALSAARAERLDASATFARLDALPPPVTDAGAGVAGWWRAAGAAPCGGPHLPTGDAFARLFGEGPP